MRGKDGPGSSYAKGFITFPTGGNGDGGSKKDQFAAEYIPCSKTSCLLNHEWPTSKRPSIQREKK